jgi:hypothetical protein
MSTEKRYLLRWVKHGKEDENGDCEIVEFGVVSTKTYDKACQYQDIVAELVRLKEFNENDFFEIVPEGDNIDIFYVEEEDDDYTDDSEDY